MIGTRAVIASRPGRRQRWAAAFALLVPLLAHGRPLRAQAQANPQTQAQPQAAAETAAPCGATDPPAAPRLLVRVTGAHSARGNITFTLYGEKPASFLAHKGSIAIARVMLNGTQATACFSVSSPGLYALAVYHDENNNHRLDRTLIGLPAEGYGFSNDAPVRLGPPSFSAARFAVQPGDNPVAIRLRY